MFSLAKTKHNNYFFVLQFYFCSWSRHHLSRSQAILVPCFEWIWAQEEKLGVGPGAVATPPAAADVIWAWLRVSALLKGFGLEVAIGTADMLLSRLKIKKSAYFLTDSLSGFHFSINYQEVMGYVINGTISIIRCLYLKLPFLDKKWWRCIQIILLLNL